jgi:arginine-tRNA-protein transferase
MQQLRFFTSQAHACSYLPDELAVNVVADPRVTPSPDVYQALLEMGFRRSGDLVYAPHCPNCRACVPVRMPVEQFRPSRAQRRTLRANTDLEVRVTPAAYRDDLFALYRDYLCGRHAGGGMDNPTPQGFVDFLCSSWCPTRFVEFLLDGRTVAVGVYDALPDAFSAVYTFFDPRLDPARGLGNLTVLWQIEEARAQGLTHVYLGYWIEAAPKMRYKSRYRPLEAYVTGEWHRLDTGLSAAPDCAASNT